MAGDGATESKSGGEGAPGEPEAPKRSFSDWLIQEARETGLTVIIFIPLWLVFQTFIYELRSIPSESMVPTLQVGDRVAVAKFPYGYNRNSGAFGITTWFIGDDPKKPAERFLGGMPNRGDVVVFQHPHDKAKVMIKRLVGLPGDRIQMKSGRLYLNDQLIERNFVRHVVYVSEGDDGIQHPQEADEYTEQLPGEDKPHVIHEWMDTGPLDGTPVFTVPPDHVFMMGDNRDNSEDSRACSGHPSTVAIAREAWNGCMLGGEMAVGYVPLDHLIGRADTVLFTLHGCRQFEGAECLPSRWLKGLKN